MAATGLVVYSMAWRSPAWPGVYSNGAGGLQQWSWWSKAGAVAYNGGVPADQPDPNDVKRLQPAVQHLGEYQHAARLETDVYRHVYRHLDGHAMKYRCILRSTVC